MTAAIQYDRALLENVVRTFQDLVGRHGEHAITSGDQVYVQPYVYLSFHLIQMRTAGWREVDFDQLAAVSGASALFGYEPEEFAPKYAHLMVGADARIAAATGFGYEWIDFAGTESAWEIIRTSIDAGVSVKGWDWENILFAGYGDAATPQERAVFAIADGPGTFAKWWTWQEFAEWVRRIESWNSAALGRFSGRADQKDPHAIARQVVQDLVDWTVSPPDSVTRRFPKAAWGLEGIRMYAEDCASVMTYGDWMACHAINPQWALRNSTCIYLRNVTEAGLFSEVINAHLSAAADHYWGAFTCWQAFYNLLGHHAPADAGKMAFRREAGAAVVRAWLAHETAAVGELRRALELL
jgi:hypothetical protein